MFMKSSNLPPVEPGHQYNRNVRNFTSDQATHILEVTAAWDCYMHCKYTSCKSLTRYHVQQTTKLLRLSEVFYDTQCQATYKLSSEQHDQTRINSEVAGMHLRSCNPQSVKNTSHRIL